MTEIIRFAHFLFTRSNGIIIRIKPFSCQKNDVFFHIFDQIKVSRVVNLALPSLHGGPLEITRTIPLNLINFRIFFNLIWKEDP